MRLMTDVFSSPANTHIAKMLQVSEGTIRRKKEEEKEEYNSYVRKFYTTTSGLNSACEIAIVDDMYMNRPLRIYKDYSPALRAERQGLKVIEKIKKKINRNWLIEGMKGFKIMNNNELKIFENKEFGKVRTVEVNGEPYFVGKDIADTLGYQNGSRDINRHVDEDDRRKFMIFDGNQDKETIIINESGLYSLILSSKLPKAKQFKRWVTSEILPTIRKTGGYVNNTDMFVNTYLPFADDNTKNLFRLQLEIITQLNNKIEEDKPKVEFANTVSSTEELISMGDMAKLIQKETGNKKIGRTRLFEFLRKQKVLMKNNVPYQRYIENGWFKVTESAYIVDGETNITLTTRVTGKGQIALLKFVNDNYWLNKF